MSLEIESRYLAPERALYERLLHIEALGPYTLTPQGWQRVRDSYLDTADRALGKQGWSCRLRREDGLRRSINLKGPAQAEGPCVSRAEYAIPLPEKTLDVSRWPAGEWRDQVLRLAGGAPLRPLVRVRQRRYHLTVKEDQRLVARLSLDRMRVRAQGARQERYLAECELMGDGQIADLLALDDILVNDYGLEREPRSKQQLALLLIEQAEAAPQPSAKGVGLRPKDRAPQAAAKILLYHTERMLANEPGVRQGQDPEAVHDMRVATRRLRSALGFLGPFLRDPQISLLAPRLQRLGRLLGAVRDLDVALERARAFARSHPSAGDLEPLLRAWERQRAKDHRRLVRYLDSPGHAEWLRGWQALLARMAKPGDQAAPCIGAMAPLLVYLHWRTVWSYDRVLEGAPIEMLHALRIGCKRLRYGLECCAEVLPPRIVRRIPEITALQDHLGALNDHATTIAMLEAALKKRGVQDARQAVSAYRAYAEQQAALLAASFGGRWARFTRRETRRSFAALAR
jgi:CHAD domain-containing protein